MKITAILPRRGRLFEVRFDDGTYINLDRTYAKPLSLSVGQDISEEKADSMEDESDLFRCKNRAMYYLSHSDLSERKLREKLFKAGFEECFVNKTTERLKELSYIDDQRLACRFYEKCQESGLSRWQATEKLIRLGISREIIKEVCVSSDDEKDKIRRLLKTKYRNKITAEEGIRKTTAALCRRGFAFSDIKAVINEFSDTLCDTYEE